MTRILIRLWLAALLLFAIAPGIDLWVSGLFHSEARGVFPADHSALLGIVRELIWDLANLLALTALVFGCHALFSARTALPGKVWTFSLLLVVSAPMLLVNGILKRFWGRARPAEITEFGGSLPFTPPWQIAGNCADNCSFVSGEASAVTVAAILIGLFLWNEVSNRRRLVAILSVLVVVGAGLRVAKGRHFLSDALWSVLLTVTIAWILWQWLRMSEVLPRITLAAFRTDARALWSGLTRRFRGRG
ncbi:phosphatase PAP2 family protein [Rhodobacterales bacterium HKCCE2091]|nr:phosphatase PAP2 family protein [Rhodobacterales bacterium HKCCE2091]